MEMVKRQTISLAKRLGEALKVTGIAIQIMFFVCCLATLFVPFILLDTFVDWVNVD